MRALEAALRISPRYSQSASAGLGRSSSLSQRVQKPGKVASNRPNADYVTVREK